MATKLKGYGLGLSCRDTKKKLVLRLPLDMRRQQKNEQI